MINIVLWILLSLFAGSIGSLATAPAIPTWYAGLTKPFFNPPNWLFGPAWTILYILMGMAIAIFLNTKTKDKTIKRKGAILFVTQLLLNSLWSILFFGFKLPLVALLEIAILLSLIVYLAQLFKKISKTAAYLLYPYIGWVAFASILNLAIVLLN